MNAIVLLPANRNVADWECGLKVLLNSVFFFNCSTQNDDPPVRTETAARQQNGGTASHSASELKGLLATRVFLCNKAGTDVKEDEMGMFPKHPLNEGIPPLFLDTES